MLELFRPLLFVFTISVTFLLSSPNVCAEEVWISTSHGVYKLGEEKPVYQKLFKGKSLTAFKTEILPNNWAITAWGVGRNPVATEKADVAILEMINLADLNERIELVKTKGKRIRDFVVDKNNIVAVGHFNGNVHFISLDTKKQKLINLSDYDGAIIHAIEKADLDRDGVNEYYITVTSPNVTGGLGQEGVVVRLDINWQTMETKSQTVINLFNEYSSYAREIAIVDLDNDGASELLVEVSPQIEVYNAGEEVYSEPMRLIAIQYTDKGYLFTPISEANIRLGRTLSYDDIDRDEQPELYFVDYYKSGVYVLEKKGERIKARGKNANKLNNKYILTNIMMPQTNKNNGAQWSTFKSNQILFDPEMAKLYVLGDYELPSPGPNNTITGGAPLRVLSLELLSKLETYQLNYKSTDIIDEKGHAWHIHLRHATN